MAARGQKRTIGERWDARKLRRIREDGWFSQHEAELIAAARNRPAAKAGTLKPAMLETGSKASESEYDAALRRAKAIMARAMDLIGDVDRPPSPGPK